MLDGARSSSDFPISPSTSSCLVAEERSQDVVNVLSMRISIYSIPSTLFCYHYFDGRFGPERRKGRSLKKRFLGRIPEGEEQLLLLLAVIIVYQTEYL